MKSRLKERSPAVVGDEAFVAYEFESAETYARG